LNTDLRCPQCGGPFWELEWRWRIPQKDDDQGWRDLEVKVSRDAVEWLPRRRKMGEEKLTEIDRQIQSVQRQKPSGMRTRRLRQLQAKRRTIARQFTDPQQFCPSE